MTVWAFSHSVLPHPVDQSVIDHAELSEAQRLTWFKRAWDAYYGVSEKPLPKAEDGQDDNVRLGAARFIVDKGASFLFGGDGQGVQVQVEDENDSTLIDEAWPVERRALQLHQLAVNGGVTGHAVVRLTRTGRVIVVDPGNFDASWSPDDLEQVLEYRITWTVVDGAAGQAFARRQRIIPDGSGWLTLEERSSSIGSGWEVIGEESWPWPWPPIVHAQNLPAPNEFWGLADLEPQTLDLIASLEAVAGRMNRVIRLLGYPLPYVTGETASRLETLEVAAGRLLAIPNQDAKVGQLDLRAELTGALGLYRELRQALHEQTRIPEVASGKLENAGSLSGVALKILYGPAVEVTGTKRLTYGPMVRAIAERVLTLTGHGERTVGLLWPGVVPEDEQAEQMTLEGDLRMGVVSRQTVAERRGYNWAEEERRIGEERGNVGASLLDAFNAGASGQGA